MIQVWLIDENGYYLNKSKFVDKVGLNMTEVPLLVGYVKPQLINGEWVEGATEEEIQAYNDAKPIIAPIKTNEELTEENNHLWQTVEFLLKNTGFIPGEGV